MPSNGMITYKAYLYPEQSDVLEALRSSEGVPTARLFRECFLHVMNDPEALERVLNRCKQCSYRKTGANVGVWTEYIKKRKNAEKKEK